MSISLHLVVPFGFQTKTRPASLFPRTYISEGNTASFQALPGGWNVLPSCARTQVTQSVWHNPALFGLRALHYSLQVIHLPCEEESDANLLRWILGCTMTGICSTWVARVRNSWYPSSGFPSYYKLLWKFTFFSDRLIIPNPLLLTLLCKMEIVNLLVRKRKHDLFFWTIIFQTPKHVLIFKPARHFWRQ